MVGSIDIYLPAAPFLMRYFATSEWMIQLSMMLTPIVASIVGLVFGHWSDTQGRRPAMLWSLGLFAGGSFACCLAWNIESFLAFRFFQAIGAGGISVIGLSVLADMFSGSLYARYMATYSMGYPIMFALAPVVGAYLFEWFSWHANFWFLGLLSFLLWGIFFKIMPETLEKNGQSSSLSAMFVNFKALSMSKTFMILGICHSLPVAISAIYSANCSFIFIDRFNFSPHAFAYIQLVPVLMNLLGSFIYREQVTKWGVAKSIRFGMYLNSAFLVATIFGSSFAELQFPLPIIIIMCILNLGLSCIIASANTKAIECVPDKRGLAAAFLGLLRNGLVAGLVLVVGAFFNGTIVPVYLGMAILTAILIFLIRPFARGVS